MFVNDPWFLSDSLTIHLLTFPRFNKTLAMAWNFLVIENKRYP